MPETPERPDPVRLMLDTCNRLHQIERDYAEDQHEAAWLGAARSVLRKMMEREEMAAREREAGDAVSSSCPRCVLWRHTDCPVGATLAPGTLCPAFRGYA